MKHMTHRSISAGMNRRRLLQYGAATLAGTSLPAQAAHAQEASPVAAGDIPVTGDWNKDGVDTPGVVRGNTWYLKNSLSGGWEDVSFQFGEPGDIPITGDWNGDGIDTPGVVRGDQWFLRNNLTHGWADQSFQYGNPDNIPLVGDWQNTGYSAPGVLQ